MTCVLHRWSEIEHIGAGNYRCLRCQGDFLRGADSGEYCGDLAIGIEVADGMVTLNEIGRAVLAQSEAYCHILRLAAQGVTEQVFLAARPQGHNGKRGATIEEGLEVYRQGYDALLSSVRSNDTQARDFIVQAVAEWEDSQGHLFPRRPIRKLWEVHRVRRSSGETVEVGEAGTWSVLLEQQACKLAAATHGGKEWDYEARCIGDAALPVLQLDDAVSGVAADLATQGINLVELPWDTQSRQLQVLFESLSKAVEREGLVMVLARGPRGILDRTITSLLGALAPVAILQAGKGLLLHRRTESPKTVLAALPGGAALYGRITATMLRDLQRRARSGQVNEAGATR